MNDDIAELLASLTEGESELAQRCLDDPKFYRTTVGMVESLEDFYQQTDNDGDALESFKRRLREWIRNPSESYIGFWGELHVAYWLSQHHIPHCFLDESQESQKPDLALESSGREICFEVKTLQENRYEWFATKVLEKIRSFLPDRGIGVEYLEIETGEEESLVAKAVEKIRCDWLAGPYSPIEYEGSEGKFSILLPKDGGVISSWPESRVRQDGTPWLESKLEATLRNNIGQFQVDIPTFLVWVSFDKLLPDFQFHVSQVLNRDGAELAEVAGVVVLEPFVKWGLSENRFYSDYAGLKREDVFDSIRDFKQQ
jgi:hypothetical protein